MPFSHLPALLSAWLSQIAAALDRRSAPRLLALFCGALFARGRRTVTSWFRAAGITDEYRRAYGALWAAGRQASDFQGNDELDAGRPLSLGSRVGRGRRHASSFRHE
jgi:hypothetical protein